MEAVSKHLVERLGPLVLDRFEALLPSGDKGRGNRQAGEASVIDYAETVAAAFAWETNVGKHVLVRAAIKTRLARVAAACVARIERHLGFENDTDIPDFRPLGRDLLLVILHVHESDQAERDAGSHPFVLTIGEQALRDFVTGLSHMTARYLQIAEQNLLEGGAPGAFVMSVLQVLERILRVESVLGPVVGPLGIELDHEATVKRMLAMRRKLLAVIDTPRANREHAARLAAIDRALPAVGA
jgi:hypothetical protein